MTDPDHECAQRTSTGLDLTSPALWAFLGEFPSAGLALGAWLHDERDAAGRRDVSAADVRR